MIKWNHSIDISDVFHSEALSYPERRDAIVARFRVAQWFKSAVTAGEDIGYMLDDLASSETASDFDVVWSEIYDWCDENRVWVNT